MKMCCQIVSSPIGDLYIAADTLSLRTVVFKNEWSAIKAKLGEVHNESNGLIQKTQTQLWEYFAKERTEFDLPVAFSGTPFQKKTWLALLTIPYGETRSYSYQAELIGNPKAVRALGRTNGLNPIAIVVPCHRVIGKSGKLTGYAGGLDKKEFLLELERRD